MWTDIFSTDFLGRMARKQYEDLRKEAAAVCIQKHVRRWLAQKSYAKTRKAAIFVQAGVRGMIARKEFRRRRQTKAAIIIQVCKRCLSPKPSKLLLFGLRGPHTFNRYLCRFLTFGSISV